MQIRHLAGLCLANSRNLVARWEAAETANLRNVSPLLGGSWVVISGVISPPIWAVITATLLPLLITPFKNTHEPPSKDPKESILVAILNLDP